MGSLDKRQNLLGWSSLTNLVNVRLLFLFAALVHLVVTAVVALRIDTTVDDDPRVRSYYYIRWKLLTCWFNILTLVYLPVRIYADWKTKRSENLRRVKYLNHATDVLMTSVILPITGFSCLVFWSIYLTNPSHLAPVRVFHYLPYWSQHSLHTVSFAVVLVDLFLTPRRRPSSIKQRLMLLYGFLSIYSAMVYYYIRRGEYVYALFEHMNQIQLLMFLLISFLIHFILFKLQWFAIDILWQQKVQLESVKKTFKHKNRKIKYTD